MRPIGLMKDSTGLKSVLLNHLGVHLIKFIQTVSGRGVTYVRAVVYGDSCLPPPGSGRVHEEVAGIFVNRWAPEPTHAFLGIVRPSLLPPVLTAGSLFIALATTRVIFIAVVCVGKALQSLMSRNDRPGAG